MQNSPGVANLSREDQPCFSGKEESCDFFLTHASKTQHLKNVKLSEKATPSSALTFCGECHMQLWGHLIKSCEWRKLSCLTQVWSAHQGRICPCVGTLSSLWLWLWPIFQLSWEGGGRGGKGWRTYWVPCWPLRNFQIITEACQQMSASEYAVNHTSARVGSGAFESTKPDWLADISVSSHTTDSQSVPAN